MTYKEYHSKHCSSHYNLCWIDGEDKLVSKSVFNILHKIKYMLFSYILGFGKL